jgi:alkylated DNA repair protein (DNA oxidative demethylase)
MSLTPGACLLPAFARDSAAVLWEALQEVTAAAGFRHFKTPGGLPMSVAATNCGRFGWVSDRRGYRYERCDPLRAVAWPPMPEPFAEVARQAAAAGGFADFVPDACLINRYEPGARMSLHQDRDERDFGFPIVSISLGLSAVFLLGGATRSAATMKIPLQHGDVLVFGGASRLRYHGVLPVKPGIHELTGAARLNLTLRRAY